MNSDEFSKTEDLKAKLYKNNGNKPLVYVDKSSPYDLWPFIEADIEKLMGNEVRLKLRSMKGLIGSTSANGNQFLLGLNGRWREV